MDVGRIRVMHSHREVGLGLVQGCRRVREDPRHRRAVVDDELLERGADDRRAIRVPRDRDGNRLTAAAGQHTGVPTARYEGVTLAHEKAVAGVSRRRWIVDHRGRGIVQQAEGEVVAAVVDLEKDSVVTRGRVDRPQDVEVRRILDHPPGVARRQRDIGDDRIAGVVRIDFAMRAPDDLLIRADVAE